MPMPWVSYLNATELPARPDPRTGRPWPPHAPGFHDARDPRRDQGQPPDPPPGQSPTLVWYRASRGNAVTTMAIGFVFVAIVFTVGLGLDWVTTWAIWPIIILTFAGIYFSLRACGAGIDWLARRKTWVKTYELVKVTCRTNHGDPELRLVDSDGRGVEVAISDLQGDRRIWDLTYNGILHSVIAGGAQTNGQLHMMLRLPYPGPATRAHKAAQPTENDSNDDRIDES